MREHEHIARVPLPWRQQDDALTECGLPADGRTTLSRAQMAEKIKSQGQQRASLSSCMTCWNTARAHDREHFTDGILDVVQREIQRVHWREGSDRDRLRDEMRAIVSLIETHRAEFDALVASYGEVVSLTKERQKRRSAR